MRDAIAESSTVREALVRDKELKDEGCEEWDRQCPPVCKDAEVQCASSPEGVVLRAAAFEERIPLRVLRFQGVSSLPVWAVL